MRNKRNRRHKLPNLKPLARAQQAGGSEAGRWVVSQDSELKTLLDTVLISDLAVRNVNQQLPPMLFGQAPLVSLTLTLNPKP